MRALRALLVRVHGLFSQSRRDRDFAEELEAHLQAHVDDGLRAGMSPVQARRAALLKLGAVEPLKEDHRDRRGLPMVETLLSDLRHAQRSLRRNPGSTAVAALSLALGIGVNLTLFTAVDSLLLQRPTVRDSARLVGVEPGSGDEFSYANFRDLENSGIFADVVGSNVTRLNLRSGDDVEVVMGLIVTANFFQTLGVTTRLGRIFTASEAAPERDPRLAVLSHAFWMRRFQGDISLLGKSIDLNGERFLVLGVLPQNHHAVTAFISPDLYVPVSEALAPNMNSREGGLGVSVLARLRENGTIAQAQAAVTAFGQELERIYPGPNEGLGRPAKVFSMQGTHLRGAPPGMFLFGGLLAGLCGLVLLIACANVAGLLLARAAVRQRELAVRVALGASRGRLIQSLLTESLLLALLGAGTGLLLALRLAPALSVVSLPGLAPVQIDLQPDFNLYAYGVVLALLTGLICGILPALRATGPDAGAEIQGAGRGSTGRLRMRNVFVVGQVAASAALLVVSSLFLRSLVHQATADAGFDVEHGLVAQFRLEPNRYSKERTILFAQQVVDRLMTIPGARAAAVASIVPFSGDTMATRLQLEVEGKPVTGGQRTFLNHVGPDYFKTLAIPLLRGREFQTGDRTGSPLVAIVNQAFANEYFPDGDALGRHVGYRGQPPLEIVGIVKDAKYGVGNGNAQTVLYVPWAQLPAAATEARPLVVHLRLEGTPAAALQSVRRAITELDKAVAVVVNTLEKATSFDLSVRRAGSVLLGMLGGLGLLLAMIGLYGVMSYAVASRTTEFGIRLALGATSRQLLVAVLADGVRLVVIGVALGIALSLMASPPLAAFLAGLSPADPLAFGGTALILLLVGACASYLPARRATQIDPMAALRRE
ncbi:MAG TPA: ABC transporter permease [Vicinamibacterales bacterium]|nr:ABC transporter permease [Vicinamibacterales bacterium]